MDTLISPSALRSMMDEETSNIILIDTRSPDMYDAGHIPSAVNIHEIFTYLAMTTPDGLSDLVDTFAQKFGAAGLGGAETAVVYEDRMDTGFGQSCRGYVLLRYLGYPASKTFILDGGIAAWLDAGGPTTSDQSLPTPRSFPLSADSTLLVHLEEMERLINSPCDDLVLLDTRDPEEWHGASSSPYGIDFCPRKGRMPKAKWIEWRRMMEDSSAGARLKNPPAIIKECETVDIRPDSNIIVYCFKGARASNTFVALQKAGFENVRLYMGGWNEWSRNLSLPIESVNSTVAA